MGNILQDLLTKECGLVFFSAPTQSGKTQLVKALKNRRKNVIILSGEQFFDAVLLQLKTNEESDLLCEYVRYDCICIEDLDWYYGREYTQHEFAAALSRLSKNTVVIVTGVDLKNRLKHMFSKLELFDYFEKSEATDEWELIPFC